ncbi:MAG: hypothetical protein ACODAE_02980 [Gemmatimonadota bacterium]
MRRIDVERIAVRLSGVSAHTARAALSGLEAEIGRELGRRAREGAAVRPGRLPRIELGTVRLRAGAAPAEVRGEIARAVVDAAVSARQRGGVGIAGESARASARSASSRTGSTRRATGSTREGTAAMRAGGGAPPPAGIARPRDDG